MMDRREKWTKVRIRFVASLFVVAFAIVSARAVYLQVIKKEQLLKLAEKQHQGIIQLTPGRGDIYDCNKAPLAVSVEMDSCFAEPRNVENIPAAAALLAPVLGVSRDELLRKMQGSKNFCWLQRQVTPEKAQKVRDLEIEGIGFVKESKRFYPNAEIASHVIGFTGLDPAGLEGVELKYNATILGNTGYIVTERDALGRNVALKGMVVKKASKGQNVTLTLDKNIQYLAEKELAKAVLGSRAKAGIALVMEPQTGKILAMANYPNFNPNAYSDFGPQQLRDRAVADSFEPGSTFKVFLVAAALEEKIVTPREGFNCENGSYNIGGRTIHDTHRYGRLSVAEVLKYSSNIGAAKIGTRLGPERLYNYLRSFGFGERSGIDLPGEASGYLRGRNQWFGVDLATISFGQGVSANAVQIAAAISAIANGGVLMKPYVVEQISDDTGTVMQKITPQVRQRVVSPEVARTVARMLEGVTLPGGTGTNAAVDGYSVAGKTGTAQKVDPVTHGYSLDKRTASFVGFVPVENPRLTILVVIDEPKTSPYGGVVAAPAFQAIAQQTLCYLRIPPEKELKKRPEPVEVKNPVAEEQQMTAAEGVIEEAGEGSVMPNFRGMSMRQVMQTMEKRGLNVKLLGSGRAIEQNPQPGRKVGPSEPVWIKFAPAA
ncbi:MAG: penicillin-binding protein [Geobacter sp.]|nr:MAG: penicillin-binding protein [Geobacter sp.]